MLQDSVVEEIEEVEENEEEGEKVDEEERGTAIEEEEEKEDLDIEENDTKHGTIQDIKSWWEGRMYKRAEDVPNPDWTVYREAGGLPEEIDPITEEIIKWGRRNRVTAMGQGEMLEIIQKILLKTESSINIPATRYLLQVEEKKKFPPFAQYSFKDPKTGIYLLHFSLFSSFSHTFLT